MLQIITAMTNYKTPEFKILDVDFERSNKIDADNAYYISSVTLNSLEINSIARHLTYAINRTQKQIIRWEMHKQNEGQVHYHERISKLRQEIKLYQELMEANEHNKKLIKLN